MKVQCLCLFFQIFESNLGKEKLQRVKLGAGKALRVRGCEVFNDVYMVCFCGVFNML